ncbi:MAG: hypothetical protein MRY78_03015 [Saprospiraceae bacterium]|nr:hypothetical protein [Saprospiraceae bacterium]
MSKTIKPGHRLMPIIGSLLLLCSVFIYSCEKENFADDLAEDAPTFVENAAPLIFNVSDQDVLSRSLAGMSLQRTKLGAARPNPYSVENVAAAHRSLFNSSIQRMEPTDLYVKFMPSSFEDLERLQNSGEFFYDFPLEYEVEVMGDYFQEIPEGTFPTLYAVVKPGFEMPAVSHEILAGLYLDESDPLLLAESFRLLGMSNKVEEQFSDAYLNDLEIESLLIPDPLDVNCPPGCEVALRINKSTIPFTYEWYCDCDGTDGPQYNPYTINDCGCEVYSNDRKPGGCVKVEDSQKSSPGNYNTFEPVRRVKVITKDTWFSERETYTDDNGCWKINKSYSGSAWFWIKFSNDRCKLRGTADGMKSIIEWSYTVKDYVGKLAGPNFNDIQVIYHLYGNSGSQAHRFWAAATVNNAVHEFYDMAEEDNIATPPAKLDIYMGRNHTHGYALMGAQDAMISSLLTELLESVFGAEFSELLGIVSQYTIRWLLPDVYVGVDQPFSDKVKKTAFQQLGNASRYTLVGEDYWTALTTAKINANGNGDHDGPDADLISISESWCEYLGYDYTHRVYGDLASGIDNYEFQLERLRFKEHQHVPTGLHHDLIDYAESGISCNESGGDCQQVQDFVSGFTREQLFQSLNGDVFSLEDYRVYLKDNYLASTNNQLVYFNALFDSYD